MIKDAELKIKSRGGGNIVSLPPKFSRNGQYVFIASKNVVYCYNTKTGKLFVEYRGLDKEVIGFGVVVMDEIEYVCACSSTGLVNLWKVESGIRLKKANIPHNQLKSFKVIAKHSQTKTIVKAVASWKKKSKLCFGFLDLCSLKWQDFKLSLNVQDDYLLDVGGPCTNLFMSIAQGLELFFVRFQSIEQVYKKSTKGKSRAFTCIACHPEHECVLTGDKSGRVLVWQNLKEKNHTQAVYHWHTLPVKTVCFSTSGTSFYSGGSESVLVKWNLDNPQDRKFLPRLPSAIEQITVANDNLYIAVATADNAVHTFDAHFTILSNIQHFVFGDRFPAGITFDPRSKSLVLNGITGHLQFYSPHDSRLLYNLDIVNMNKLTAERDVSIENVQVTKVSISRNALWMVTLEELDDRDPLYYESRLKFWNFNTKIQSFELNTSVESPHNGKTTSVKFQPSMKDIGLKCVTIGEDKRFKVWVLIDATTVYRKGNAWRCASSALYRDLTPKAIAFSCDGSLLAIPFDNILTTWLPDSCKVKCSLVHPKYKGEIIDVAFGTSAQCHLLVSASRRHLSVWNLLTLSMVWIVEINVAHLVADIMLEHMAVFSTDGKLFVFYPESSQPIYTHESVVDDDTSVLSAVFIPNSFISDKKYKWFQKSDLLFIDSKKQLHSIDNKEENSEHIRFHHEEEPGSLFGQILPHQKSNSMALLKPVSHKYTDASAKKYMDELLYAPIQTMTPLSLLVNSVVKGMLFKKSQQSNGQETIEPTGEFGSDNIVDDQKSKSLGNELDDDLSVVGREQTSWVNLVFS